MSDEFAKEAGHIKAQRDLIYSKAKAVAETILEDKIQYFSRSAINKLMREMVEGIKEIRESKHV